MTSLKVLADKLTEVISSRKSSVGNWKIASIAISGTISGAVDLGGHFSHIMIQIPTIDSANVSLQVAEALEGSYDDLGLSTNVLAAGTGSFYDTFKVGGWRYVKVKVSAAQNSGGVIFQLCGVTY